MPWVLWFFFDAMCPGSHKGMAPKTDKRDRVRKVRVKEIENRVFVAVNHFFASF